MEGKINMDYNSSNTMKSINEALNNRYFYIHEDDLVKNRKDFI